MASAKTFTVFTKFAVKGDGTVNKSLGTMAKGSEKFHKNVEKMRKGVERLKKTGEFMKRAFEAAAIFEAGKQILEFSKASIEAASEIRDTAEALGISTKALQEYQYAGEQVGITSEDMSNAIRKLTVNLGKDGGDVENALYQIGLTAEDLKAAGPDHVLETVANGFKNLQDPTKKAAVATALFGKGSVRMVNMLSQGADGVKNLRDEAEQVGAVMDGSAISSLADYDDQLKKLSATAGGLRNRLSVGAVPILKKVTDFIQKGIQPGGQFDKVLNSMGGTLGKVGSFVGPLLDKLLAHLPKFLEFAGNIVDALGPVFAPLMDFIEQILSVAEKLMPLITGIVKVVATVLGPILSAMADILKAAGVVMDAGVSLPVAGFGAGQGGTPERRKADAARFKTASPDGVPMSANTVPLSSSTTSTSKVDISVGNLPPGSSVKQDKPAPGVTLNAGRLVGAR